MTASTVPYRKALIRFPPMVLRIGTRGWNSSANSSAKNTPSVKCESSPTKYTAAVGAVPLAGEIPRRRSPLATGQFTLGRPNPENQTPKTVANWVATAPARSEPPIGCRTSHARHLGSVSSVGMPVMNPEPPERGGLSMVTELICIAFAAREPNCPKCVPLQGMAQYLHGGRFGANEDSLITSGA